MVTVCLTGQNWRNLLLRLLQQLHLLAFIIQNYLHGILKQPIFLLILYPISVFVRRKISEDDRSDVLYCRSNLTLRYLLIVFTLQCVILKNVYVWVRTAVLLCRFSLQSVVERVSCMHISSSSLQTMWQINNFFLVQFAIGLCIGRHSANGFSAF